MPTMMIKLVLKDTKPERITKEGLETQYAGRDRESDRGRHMEAAGGGRYRVSGRREWRKLAGGRRREEGGGVPQGNDPTGV